MQKQETYIPWRERAFVSISEGAVILARSPDWIRNRIYEGRLEGRRLTKGGPLVLTVGSVLRLIGEVELADSHDVKQPSARPALRLVVSNPHAPGPGDHRGAWPT